MPGNWPHGMLLSQALDVLIATIMDTLQQIALTRYHLQACWHDAEITPLVDVTDQCLAAATPGILTMTIEDRRRFSRSLSCSHNPRYRSNSRSDSCRSHSKSFH